MIKNLIKKIVIYPLILVILAGFLVPIGSISAVEPLTIYGINITKTDRSATISWQTNRKTTGKIEWGLYSNDYRWTIRTNEKKLEHTMTLVGLANETDYYFRISVEDETSAVISFEQNFETREEGDNKSPIISDVQVVYTTGDTATFQWYTNEPATSEVEYGMTTDYGSTATDGHRVKIHDFTVRGLVDGTYYHFRVRSKDKDNNTSRWYDMTFTTKLTDISDRENPEIFAINPVSENDIHITETTAVITWRTSKLAEGFVRYGVNSNFGKTINTNPPRDFYNAVTLIDLSPNTIYYFEIEVKDVNGRRVKSPRYSFKTKGASQNIQPQVLGASTQGLLVYLPFDEGSGEVTYDQSFNGNDGIFDSNNTPQWTDGRFGKALNFSGRSENVEVPDNDTIRFRNSLSVLTWIKIDEFGDYDKMVSKEDAYELILGPDDGVLRLALYPQGAKDWIWLNSPSRPLEIGQWYLVAGTYDGQIMRIYVNASQVGQRSETVTINNSTHPLYIGGNVVDNREWFNGLIDEVAVFDYALTAQEISNIYANGVGQYLDTSGIPTRGDNTGTVLGVSIVAPAPAVSNYPCNPELGYSKINALYKTASSPDIWAILDTGQKHYITSPQAFNKYECDWSRITIVSQNTLNSYTNANLVRTPDNATIYHLFQRPDHQWLKINIPSPTIFISYDHNYWGNVARVDALDIESYPNTILIKAIGSPETYLIEGRFKRHISSSQVFERLGYDWAEVVEISQIHLDSYENGLVVN